MKMGGAESPRFANRGQRRASKIGESRERYRMRNEDQRRRELEAAGWEPGERDGEPIWRNPTNGYWYPQDIAAAMLGEGADADVPLEPEGGA